MAGCLQSGKLACCLQAKELQYQLMKLDETIQASLWMHACRCKQYTLKAHINQGINRRKQRSDSVATSILERAARSAPCWYGLRDVVECNVWVRFRLRRVLYV